MTWFLDALFVTACAASAAAIAGILLLFFKRPLLAHRVAKRATLIAVVVLGVAIAELSVMWAAPGPIAPLVVRGLPAGGPYEKARALAEGISEIMNCAGLAIPAVVLGGIGWIVGRGQSKRSASATRG